MHLSTMRFTTLTAAALLIALQGCSSRGVFSSSPPLHTLKVLVVTRTGINETEASLTFRRANNLAHELLHLNLEEVGPYRFDWGRSHLSPVRHTFAWRKFLNSQILPPADAAIVLLKRPRIAGNNGAYPCGHAQGLGLVGRIDKPTALVYLSNNIEADARALVHEISHLLGATHRDCGIMHPDCDKATKSSELCKASLKEMQAALNRLRVTPVSEPQEIKHPSCLPPNQSLFLSDTPQFHSSINSEQQIDGSAGRFNSSR